MRSQWSLQCWGLQMLLCCHFILVWRMILLSMQVAAHQRHLVDLTVWCARAHPVPSAFQLVKGISNYSSSHITFSLNCNRLSQHSIYKMAFHTTTHQINTSRRKEKSAAPKQSWLHAVAPDPAGQTHWFLWNWVVFFKQKSIYIWHLITWHFQVFQVCACVALSYHLYYEPWLSLAFSGVASISSTPAWVIRSAMFFSRSSMRVLISSSEAAVQEHNWHQSS